VKASSASATTGRPSLAKLFHNPEVSSDTDVRLREKPHEEFIA
jgi:hypothetical protein